MRFGDIADGSSHTILIGEMLPELDSLGWASGTRASLRNTGWLNGVSMTPEATVVERYPLPGSHPGGAQFCFADGSVRFLSHSIEPTLYQNFGNRADGEMMGTPY